jgi:hypothetical protein
MELVLEEKSVNEAMVMKAPPCYRKQSFEAP